MKTSQQINIKLFYNLKKTVLLVIFAVMVVSILLSAFLLDKSLINDSNMRTRELSLSIRSSLENLMINGDPDLIQETLEEIGRGEEAKLEIMILGRPGNVAYSSNPSDIGRIMSWFTDENCIICHVEEGSVPHNIRSVLIKKEGRSIQRNVMVLLNNSRCYGCHDKKDRINGKLIIDRSMSDTYKLILSVEIFMFIFGLILLLFIYFLLSRSFNKYIHEILQRHTEVSLLYSLLSRLSKSIEMDELRNIIIEILRDYLDADEVVIIIPKGGRVHRASLWSSSDNRLIRVKLSEFNPISVAVIDWFEQRLKDDLISEDRREIYIPIEREGNKLAMIVIKKLEKPFNMPKLQLVKAISSHLAVAFDNALLYRMAITDELTGLYTKRHFRHTIEKAFARFKESGEKFTILMLDLDNFKNVNDTYGHIVGDHVLREAGRNIQDSVKQNDFAFRYGGEEFLVLLKSTDIKGGIYVAERIRKLIEKTVFRSDGITIRLTVSIGVSNCPQNAGTINELVVTADKALYEAKRSGKNRIVASNASGS